MEKVEVIDKDKYMEEGAKAFREIPHQSMIYPAYTSPIFIPTKSQRVKNKLNRKRYGR